MPTPVEYADVPTPIGTFRIVYQGRSVKVVDLLELGVHQTGLPVGAGRRKPPFAAGSPPRQLQEYFRHARRAFDVDLDPDTTSRFDRAVWTKLSGVEAGRTTTYAELARSSGYPRSARAVGGAMARNPIPIVIPCHRVIGTGGTITGYGLGLWRKRWLLDHEGAWPIRSRSAEGPRHRDQRTLDAVPA
ncbi:MAG TPA: methylated-DNA--[protein]-cysteine S-methyltransferase [Thermoplasmata archaeon]|jgi:methylated-DNA-[protein]-cysteine S-methyltransferase|nr:methylated-DNA--[protein]-cysteine S-methyltransferase [Thermoplasmata archaeon]